MLPIPGRIAAHVRSTLKPQGFHGSRERAGFFEGRYVKMVSADRRHRWAVIPGVFLGLDGGDEAFVQVLAVPVDSPGTSGTTGPATSHRARLGLR